LDNPKQNNPHMDNWEYIATRELLWYVMYVVAYNNTTT